MSCGQLIWSGATETSEGEEACCQRRQEAEQSLEALGGFQLSRLKLTAGLEGLVIFLHVPTPVQL
jgi:hypothetical protein